PPWSTAIEGTSAGSPPLQSQGDQPFHARPGPLPFPPFQAAKLPPYPLVEFFKHVSGFRDAEVAGPAPTQRLETVEERSQVPASSLLELWPELHSEALHGVRGHSPSGHLLARQRKAKELALPRPVHCAFFGIARQFE